MGTVNLSSFTTLSSVDILERIKTVDGLNSGLDSDLFQGQPASFYRNASNLNAGTLPVARMPALTGIVTAAAGTGTTAIADGALAVSKLAPIAAQSLLGNATGDAATPIPLTAAVIKSLLALTRDDVGLSNVDNSSDVNKPISNATQLALNNKANVGHTHSIPDINGLQGALDTKLDVGASVGSAGQLTTPRAINGTNFDGTTPITTSYWGTTRTLTIGAAGKSVNGTGNVSWTLTEIGAQPALGYTAENIANKGVANGYAGLGADGKVPAAQLPASVAGPATTDELPQGTNNLYFTDTAARNAITGGASSITANNLTASRAVVSDASGKVAVSATTAAELGHLSGVTGNVQTQLSGKLDTGATAAAATKLATARAINGTSFDGSAAITTALWGTARTITIGGTGKSVDGSVNMSWSLSDIGAAASSHTHSIANVTSLQTSLDAKADLGGTPRFAGLYIGGDNDVYLYEPSANGLGVRTGASGSYRYYTFASDGSFNASNGAVSATRVYSGYDSGINGAISCNNWFRSNGSTGWVNETYGVGIYATDATYVRTYNNAQMAAADFVISSDRRLKTNIETLVYRGPIRPVSFNYIATGKRDLGFIANEVQELYPELVGVIQTEEGEYLQLSYPKLTAVLAAHLNLLAEENQSLANRLTALEERLSALENHYAGTE